MAEGDEERRLEEIAASILDGRPVDWDAVESGTDRRRLRLMRQLRLVSAVAEVHRSVGSSLPADLRGERGARPEAPSLRWGPLDLLEPLGHGSFGDVYRAWDRQLDREVALKLLYEYASDSDTSSSIVSEGRLLARVRHPNVVTVYGADRIDGRVGLWMELVQGRTLEQSLDERGPFSAQEALLAGVDLCRALSAVHQAGVVHRDVKAQNVMREKGGRIVLMDFGTGRESLTDTEEPSLTGTPLYLAPEILQGGQATTQSDIYGLGVLLFHLVSRSYPILGRSVKDLREAHREGRRVWLRDLRPDVSEDFIRIIERALAPDPRERFQTAGGMEQALLTTLAGSAVPASVHESLVQRAPGATAERQRRRLSRAAAFALAAVATVAVVTAGVTYGRRVLHQARQTPPPPSNAVPTAAAGNPDDLTAQRVSMPPTMYPGRPSPDGRYLTYVDLNGDLALYDIASGQSRTLTSKGQSQEGGESQIAVSPDGTKIAYSWVTLDGKVELRLIGEDGTWPRVLLHRSDVTFPSPLQWTADGTRILTMLEMADGTGQLVFVEAATGTVTPLRTFPGGGSHPALSPDGRFVAFAQAQKDDPRAGDVMVLDREAAGQEPEAIVEHPADDRFPIWASDDRLLFVSDRTGAAGLWSLPMADGRASGEPELLVRDLGRLLMPLGLTDNGALYYLAQNGMVDVYSQSIDLSGQVAPGTPAPARPTLIGSNMSSEWSPDGRYLAFVSLRAWVQSGRYSRTLVIRDMPSGEERRLQPSLSSFIEPRWSPDGRTIAVRGADLDGREGLFVVDITDGRTRPAVLFAPGATVSAVFQWSPGGGAIWYDNHGAIVAHDLATGREDVVIDYTDESVIQGLQQWPGFRLSPDGQSIAYTGRTFENHVPGTVVRAHLLGGGTWELARATAPERVEFQDWTPDSRGVLLIKRNPEERRNMLYEARLDGSPLRPLGVSMYGMRGVDLRPDGRAITYTAGMSTVEVWVLKGFLPVAEGQ